MFCAEWALVKNEPSKVTIIPLRCRCWTCDECRPGRAAKLIAEAKQGRPNLFVTLTTRRTPGGCPNRAARRLKRAWTIVRREYLKKHGKHSLPFLVVFEATKHGWPHMHLVARCKWLDQKWLSKRMGQLIGAPMVDVRRINGLKRIVEELCKYVGKDPRRFTGTKRYWRSKDYLYPVDDSDEKESSPWAFWEISKFNWLTEVQYYVGLGFTLTMGRREAVLERCVPP